MGRLPAAAVVGGSYVAALLASLLLPPDVKPIALWVAPLLVAVYCLIRGAEGWDILLLACAPSAGGTLASGLLGIPRWAVAWPIAVLVVVVLARRPQPA